MFSEQKIQTIKREVLRKIFHTSVALSLFIYHYSQFFALLFVFFGISFYLLLEWFRLHRGEIGVVSWIIQHVHRPHEEEGFLFAPLFLFVGVFCSLFFEKEAAMVGIFAVCFGDSIASIVGSSFHRWEIPKTGGRTLPASLACFTLLFVCYFLLLEPLALWQILLLAAVATLLELIPTDYDNLLMSIVPTLLTHAFLRS